MDSIKSVKNVNDIINTARDFKRCNTRETILQNSIFGLLFFEPSTRTCLSFESAIHRLGGKIIKYNSEYSSEKKGESLEDTIKTLNFYVDVFIIRHPEKNIISKIKKYTNKPIINAGDGDGEHPTQALLDLFTIQEYYTNLPEKIAFTGDIKHSRTIHSLVYLLKKIKNDIHFYFVSEPELQPEPELLNELNYEIVSDINDIINVIDVLYVTRQQKERFTEKNLNVKNIIINSDLISKSKENLIIMHPLPRNEELSTDLDNNPKSKYFQQVENGVFVRMAILFNLIKYIK
tara:strand:- start:25242 stop:26111 length:870 start_codon:yes stop_codon:yes gene_type:complete